MRHGEKVAICLAGGLALHTGAQATRPDSPGNPYSGIVVRNVFALTPAPPTTTISVQIPPPLQKIVLTGIVNYGGKKQVFFKTLMSAKPGEPAREISFILSEGERAGEIEILEITEVAGTVRVKNHGLEQSLSLEKDGMKPSAGAGGGLGALPAVPGLNAPGAGAPFGSVPGSSRTAVPSFEEQIVLMEINRKLNAEKVARGEMPPLPDLPFTPKAAPQ